MCPGRTFKVLIGAGILLLFLLGAAAYRAVMAGCPENLLRLDIVCLFFPTHTDFGIHLLSYVFVGVILLGAYSWLVLWRRQRVGITSLTENLELFHASDTELEPLICRLGLKGRVYRLDCETPLCFCAGFISPRMYLSQGMLEKLTSEQLEALLLHEKHHLENHDPLKILLGRLFVSALFSIPVLQDIFKRYLIEKEITADRSAILYQGHCRGIAGVLERLLQEHAAVPAEALVAGGDEALECRIDYLTGHASQHVCRIPVLHTITSFLVIAFIVAILLVPLSGVHPINADVVGMPPGYLP